MPPPPRQLVTPTAMRSLGRRAAGQLSRARWAHATDLRTIDRGIDVERAIWIMERRAGADCREARASKAKLDQLLDERTAAAGHSSRSPEP